MNIFVLDKDPKKAAQYHCDVHVRKMIVESAQMLFTAYLSQWGITKLNEERLFYNTKTHKKFFNTFLRKDEQGNTKPYRFWMFHHICSRWTRENNSNWEWVLELAINLNEEYEKRKTRKDEHATAQRIIWMKENPPILRNGELTPFVLAMPEKYQCIDPVQSYRKFYLNEKKFAKWKFWEPDWFKSMKKSL